MALKRRSPSSLAARRLLKDYYTKEAENLEKLQSFAEKNDKKNSASNLKNLAERKRTYAKRATD